MKFAVEESTCSIGLHDWILVDRKQNWYKVVEPATLTFECMGCGTHEDTLAN